MNFRGIELMRSMGLPAPRKEKIVRGFADIDLDELYEDADLDATILVFDQTEKINQYPFLEKGVRKYNVPREEFVEKFSHLLHKLSQKGVSSKDLVAVIHQSYSQQNIEYSGRAATQVDNNGLGWLAVEAVEGLRKGKKEFTPNFVYEAPIRGGRLLRSQGKLVESDFIFPQDYLDKIVADIYRIPGNPNIDFEVYLSDGQLFYHDMFLATPNL